MATNECDLQGLWRRALLQRNGKAEEVSTVALWLQGPRFFADLRQPLSRPSFGGVACLRDLNREHTAWLARQEAFAGSLELDDGIALWNRAIDLQPRTAIPDRARVRLRGDVLDEYGTELPYYEQWRRSQPATEPCWGARLIGLEEPISGFLVRVAHRFMYARSRAVDLPGCTDLSETIRQHPGLNDQQDFLDFEVSFGTIQPAGRSWVIERSTLPFKEGGTWRIEPHPGAPGARTLIGTEDLDACGRRMTRLWELIETDSVAIFADLQPFASATTQGSMTHDRDFE